VNNADRTVICGGMEGAPGGRRELSTGVGWASMAMFKKPFIALIGLFFWSSIATAVSFD
jgi:hypothetical protein